MWALKLGSVDDSHFDNTLVLAFVGHTRILTLTNEEVEETEVSGFLSDRQTFFCGNVDHNQIIQITSASVRLIHTQSGSLITGWKPSDDGRISVVACNNSQLICASACDVYYIEIKDRELIQRSQTTLSHEVACLDISILDLKSDKADLIAVGLWTDISVTILKVPTLEIMNNEKLGGEMIPRSILMTNFEGINYLLCALGDGSMFYFIEFNHFENVFKNYTMFLRIPSIFMSFMLS